MRLPLSLFLLLAALSCGSLALPVQEEKTGAVTTPDPSLAVDASTPAAPSESPKEAPASSSEESQEDDKSDEDASPAVTSPPPTPNEDKKEGDDDSSSSEEKDADAAPTEAPSATPVKEMTRGEITTLKPDPNSGLDPHDDDNTTTTKSPDTPTPTPKPSPTPTPTPAPTTAKPSPTPTTAVPVTPTAAPAVPDAGRKFDGWSFIGGIVLCLVSFAIAFVGFKYYRVRRGQAGGLGGNYNRF